MSLLTTGLVDEEFHGVGRSQSRPRRSILTVPTHGCPGNHGLEIVASKTLCATTAWMTDSGLTERKSCITSCAAVGRHHRFLDCGRPQLDVGRYALQSVRSR